MLIVAALGGNALLRRGEPADVANQRANAARAARAVAPLAQDNRLVVTHGNGPQIGFLALQAGPETPFDVLGAESEGLIGYLLVQELSNALRGRELATVLTQVRVDAGDPAFAAPTKPIGPVYDRASAERLARERGWPVMPDGAGWRRAIASPEPRGIVERAAIGTLSDAGFVVICAGGGGIPVATDADGNLHGVEAVIDKDLASALLAIELKADRLLLLTDVAAVFDAWQTPQARALRTSNPVALRVRRFAAGSMGPKVEAACRFVEAGGAQASIGSLDDAAAVLAGRSGTRVALDAPEVTW